MTYRTNVELVLVHLGKDVPSSMTGNLRNIIQKFPDLKVTVILDQIANQPIFRRLGVNTHIYSDLNQLDDLFINHEFNVNFRKGFWQKSTRRIFAFLEYFDADSDFPKIHIENDILLSEKFPFDTFLELNKCGWLSYNEYRDVGSIIYCPDVQTARWLESELRRKMSAKFDFTDMTLLRDVSKENPTKVAKFPIAENPKSPFFAEYVLEEDRLLNSQLYELFGGIFDAAPIGMWLTGQDPRNHRGKLLLHVNHADSFIQPANTIYTGSDKELSVDLTSQVPVFNLHIHSKELAVLSGEKGSLKKYIDLAQNRNQMSKLKYAVLVKIVWRFLLNRARASKHGSS